MLNDLAKAIATFEGFFANQSRARRNNNPGNLKYAGQPGAIGADAQGFAIFATPEDGWRALERQIRLDASRGHTLSSFLYKYAPPSENATTAYLDFLRTRLGLALDDLQKPLDLLLGGRSGEAGYMAVVSEAKAAWGLAVLLLLSGLLLWSILS